MSTNTTTTTTTTTAPAPSKRKAVSTAEGNTLTFRFAHGAEHTIDVTAFSREVQEAARLHGVRQTLQDAFAQKGSSQEAEALFLKRLAVLEAGTWAGAREGGGVAQERLIVALITVSGKSRPEVEALFSGDKDAAAAMRKKVAAIPAVALEVKRLELEAAEARAEAQEEDGLSALFG